jgi:hypothetical protein
MAALISTLLKAQADAQLAQTNANHANLIAFQTETAQALAHTMFASMAPRFFPGILMTFQESTLTCS